MKFCSNCGHMVEFSAAFCPSCGAALQDSAQDDAWEQEDQPQQGFSRQQPEHLQPQQDYSRQQPGNPQPQQGYYRQYSNNLQPQQGFNQQQYMQYPNYGPPQYAQHGLTRDGRPRAGGWLLFFIVGSIFDVILSIIVGLFMLLAFVVYIADYLNYAAIGLISEELASQYITWASVGIVSQVLFLVAVVMQINGISQLRNRKPAFLRIKQIMWLLIIFGGLIMLVATGMTEIDEYDSVARDIVVLFGINSLLSLLIWTVYFCKSARVQTFMGSEEFKDRAFFAFNKSAQN